MKRLLASFGLIFGLALCGQAQDVLNPSMISGSAYGSITGAGTGTDCTRSVACVWIVAPLHTAWAAVQISGTFSATLQFEWSVNGSTWVSATSTGGSTSTTSAGIWEFDLFGAQFLRVRASSYSSGTAAVTMSTAIGPLVSGSQTIATNAEYNLGTCTTAAAISPNNGNRQAITLTAGDTCALTFAQSAGSTVSIQLKVIQSSSGSFNGAISGGKWPGGTVPTITQSSGAVDFLSCYLDGTNAYCVASQNFQ